MSSFPFNRLPEEIASEPATQRGCIVVGSRFSGKSRLVSELLNANQDAMLLQSSEWLRDSSGCDLDIAMQFNRRLEDELSRLERTHQQQAWIVDDGEVLLACVSKACSAKIANAIAKEQLRLFLIRNRFVREGIGWYAQNEYAMIGGLDLPVYELSPLGVDEAERLALQMAPGAISGQENWLARWSGGWPGLIAELKEVAHENAIREQQDLPPDGRLLRIADRLRRDTGLGRDTGLARIERTAVISAALNEYLPPPVCLTNAGANEAGFLMALGMIHTDYVRRNKTIQGEFWTTVAGQVVAKSDWPEVGLSESTIRFVGLLRVTGYLDEVCLEFDVEMDEMAAAVALEKAFAFHKVAPNLVKPLNELTCELIGRVGLRRLSQAAGVPSQSSDSAETMVGRLFDDR